MKLWNDFVIERKKEFGWQTVEKWLETLKIKHFDACNLYLTANDSFQYHWVKEHIIDAKLPLKNNNGHTVKLHLEYLKNPQNKQAQQNPLKKGDFSADKILDHALFSEFVATKQSAFALKVLANASGYDLEKNCLSSTCKPLDLNPIFLCGKPSSGKTHLLMALAKSLELQQKRVRFVNGKTFTEHVVYAFRSSNMLPFRTAYRNVDALFIDDIDAIAGKAATQEEFFHTFNALHTKGVLIVLSSQFSPRFLENIEERLQSRFEWGITLNLEKVTDTTTIEAVLDKRLHLYQLKITKNLKQYILQTFKSTHLVCQAVDILNFQFQKRDSLIEKQEATPYLAFLVKKIQARTLCPDEIIKLAAQNFGLKYEDLLNKSQQREFTIPRQIAMYLLRNNLNLTYKNIAKLFDKDHSTVMSSIKKIAHALELNDPQIKNSISNLLKKLNKHVHT